MLERSDSSHPFEQGWNGLLAHRRYIADLSVPTGPSLGGRLASRHLPEGERSRCQLRPVRADHRADTSPASLRGTRDVAYATGTRVAGVAADAAVSTTIGTAADLGAAGRRRTGRDDARPSAAVGDACLTVCVAL